MRSLCMLTNYFPGIDLLGDRDTHSEEYTILLYIWCPLDDP